MIPLSTGERWVSRSQDIARRVLAGETHQDIATDLNLSRQRVHQIAKDMEITSAGYRKEHGTSRFHSTSRRHGGNDELTMAEIHKDWFSTPWPDGRYPEEIPERDWEPLI